jgi:hypothetical protein
MLLDLDVADVELVAEEAPDGAKGVGAVLGCRATAHQQEELTSAFLARHPVAQ